MTQYYRRAVATLIVAYGITFSLSAFSINNIENERLAPAPEGISGQLEAAIETKSGNSDTEESSYGAKLIYAQAPQQWLLMASREYGKSNDVKSKDNQFAHLRWTYALNTLVSSELFTQYQDDDFTRLTSRVLLGGGGRMHLPYSSDTLKLAIGLGAFHVREKYELNTFTTSDSYWRANSYISYKQAVTPQVLLVATGYYQPRIHDAPDTQVLLDANAIINMSEQLKLKLSYSVKHDSKPPEDDGLEIAKTDRESKLSIMYQF